MPTYLFLAFRITFADGTTKDVSLRDARGYIGRDRLDRFPSDGDEAHASEVQHHVRLLSQGVPFESWSGSEGRPSFTITHA